MTAHAVRSHPAIVPIHGVGSGTATVLPSHARLAFVTPSAIAHRALTGAFDSLTPLLSLLRRQDLLDLGLEIGEHFSCCASVFLTECSDAFVMRMKDFVDLLGLYGCEIEVTNETRCSTL